MISSVREGRNALLVSTDDACKPPGALGEENGTWSTTG